MRCLSISNYRRNRYTCFWHFSHGHSDVIHLYHVAFSPEEMPNDPENSHSSDQHRISWIQAVFFLLATVVDDFPLNSDLSSKQKNVSYLQGAHYSGPNIFKTLFKASVQLAVQHSSGTIDFFLLKVKPVCAGNTIYLGAGLSM